MLNTNRQYQESSHSNKLLPVLKPQQGEEGADDRPHDEVEAVVEGGFGPERRHQGFHAAEGIVEEEPGAVLHLITQHPENKWDDDQSHGESIDKFLTKCPWF